MCCTLECKCQRHLCYKNVCRFILYNAEDLLSKDCISFLRVQWSPSYAAILGEFKMWPH